MLIASVLSYSFSPRSQLRSTHFRPPLPGQSPPQGSFSEELYPCSTDGGYPKASQPNSEPLPSIPQSFAFYLLCHCWKSLRQGPRTGAGSRVAKPVEGGDPESLSHQHFFSVAAEELNFLGMSNPASPASRPAPGHHLLPSRLSDLLGGRKKQEIQKAPKSTSHIGLLVAPQPTLALSFCIVLLQAPVCLDSHQTLKTQGAKLVLKKEGILEVKAVTYHQRPLFALQTVYQAYKGHLHKPCFRGVNKTKYENVPSAKSIGITLAIKSHVTPASFPSFY